MGARVGRRTFSELAHETPPARFPLSLSTTLAPFQGVNRGKMPCVENDNVSSAGFAMGSFALPSCGGSPDDPIVAAPR